MRALDYRKDPSCRTVTSGAKSNGESKERRIRDHHACTRAHIVTDLRVNAYLTCQICGIPNLFGKKFTSQTSD